MPESSGRVSFSGPVALVGNTFPRKQDDYVLQGAQISVRPIAALLTAFLQVFLFCEAMRGLMGDPLSKFSAPIFYLAKF